MANKSGGKPSDRRAGKRKDRLIIKVEKAKTVELVKRTLELVGKESQYRNHGLYLIGIR